VSSKPLGSTGLIKFNPSAYSQGLYKVVDGSQRTQGKETLLKSDLMNFPRIFQRGTDQFSGKIQGSYFLDSMVVKYLDSPIPL
jgi:hypothetical protein